jgi:diguanylate cyclase (GGDEF)-like protein
MNFTYTRIPFGALPIDLDRFKAINDDFGHATGDRALREVGATLLAALRSVDIVGRWGGDEFVAVVLHANSDVLNRLAERCCALVAQTSVPSCDGIRVPMSVSVGGTVALPDDTATGLFKRADELMYLCKTSGRGRASIDQSGPVAARVRRTGARS